MSFSVIGGRLADRIGPRPAIITGWLVYAAVYAGFALASTTFHVWVLFLAYGLFFGLTEAPEKVMVAAMAPALRRGSAFGAYHLSTGLAALPASVLFGAVWQQAGARAAFFMGAALALLAAFSLSLLRFDRGTAGNFSGRRVTHLVE
jgi:MFS family permease